MICEGRNRERRKGTYELRTSPQETEDESRLNSSLDTLENSSSLNTPTKSSYRQCTGSYLSGRYHHPQIEVYTTRRAKITINVSGERYQTYVDTLNRFPNSLLGNSERRERFYDDIEDEYFFDRDRNAFNAILYYYQSNGELYCPLTLPIAILVTEAKFFDLGNDAIRRVLDLNEEEDDQVMPKNKWKKWVWCLFEYPETSRGAHILTFISVLMILFSVTILCIETIPYFKIKVTSPKNDSLPLDGMPLHEKKLCRCPCDDNETDAGQSTVLNTSVVKKVDWQRIFSVCETVFVAWFSFEYIARFLSCPNKCKFAKQFLNIIDVISIIPFYVTTALANQQGFGLENLRIIRLVRVFRIFKLSRHSKGLQILGETLKASMRELGLLIFFLAIGIVLFSSVVYYLEDFNFVSIPDAFWWAIITMCTVGYGDKVPITFLGKVVGSACAICGVLSVALPVPVIVSNFDYYYNRERTKNMHIGILETPDAVEEPMIEDSMDDDHSKTEIVGRKDSPAFHRLRNGSMRSPNELRHDAIRNQALMKDIEKKSRKISQKLSQNSLLSMRREKALSPSPHVGFI